jgi:hypothetical protein
MHFVCCFAKLIASKLHDEEQTTIQLALIHSSTSQFLPRPVHSFYRTSMGIFVRPKRIGLHHTNNKVPGV